MHRTRLLWLVPFAYLATDVPRLPADDPPAVERAAEQRSADDDRNIAAFLTPEDQILNESGGATTVRNSLVETGLAEGVVDGGANIDAEPRFTDYDGADFITGTIDDRVDLTAISPAVDAGDNAALPADRFDLDGDGDTTEPIPVDIAGMERAYASGGSGVVDMGAFETEAMATSAESPTAEASGPTLHLPFPNPIVGRGTLEFTMPRPERTRLDVFDVLGRRVATLFDGPAEATRAYRVEVDARDLPGGTYVARLSSPSFSKTTSFVVVK